MPADTTKSTTTSANANASSSSTASKQPVDKDEVINYFEASSLRQFIERALHTAFAQRHEQPLEVLYEMLYKDLKKDEIDKRKEEDQKAVVSELQTNHAKELEQINTRNIQLEKEYSTLKSTKENEVNELKSQILILKSKISGLETAKTDLEQQRDRLQNELNNSQKEVNNSSPKDDVMSMNMEESEKNAEETSVDEQQTADDA